MIVKHIGIRPTMSLTELDDGRLRKTFVERLDDGTRKFWNNKLLKSGCKKDTESLVEEGLQWCSHCNEWFSLNQFVGVINER